MNSVFERTQLDALELPEGTWWRRLLQQVHRLVEDSGNLWWYLVLGGLLFIYLCSQILLPGRVSADFLIYGLQPTLWLVLSLLALLGWRFGVWDRPGQRLDILLTALLIGTCQLAVFALAGLLLGFGNSPYNHQLKAVIGNLFYAGSLLVGMELSRAYLLNYLPGKNNLKTLLIIVLFFTFLSLPVSSFNRLQGTQSAIQFIGERLLPALSQNLLATYLVGLAGPLASMAYLGILLAFEWLSPVLPNPGWFISALLGTLIPALALLHVHNSFAVEETPDEENQESASTTSWIVVGVLSLFILGFNSGLFGFRPTLIGSGSMEPAIQVGDVVITKTVPVKEIQVGDVIRFRDGRVSVVHRVVDIQQHGNQVIFTTRGDDNNTDDPPISEQAYQGKVILTVPRIGWLAIYLRQGLSWIFG